MCLKAEAPLRFNAVFFQAAWFQSKFQNITTPLCALEAEKKGQNLTNKNMQPPKKTSNTSLLHVWQASSMINVM